MFVIIDNTTSLKSFQWANMSCSYDAVFTTLWIVYSTGTEKLRAAFDDTLPFMGEMFTQMTNNTTSAAEANNKLRDYYYKSSRKKCFARGVYQSVPEVIGHLLSQCIIPIHDEGMLDLFDFKNLCHKKCPHDSCELISDLESDHCIFFNNDIDYTLSLSYMIQEHFRLEPVNYLCVECRLKMSLTYELVGCPQIACICFTGKDMESNFERVIHIGVVEYNLLSVVYLVGSNHFICRFCIDNIAYEYDGMVRFGAFREVTYDPPFPGTTYDADNDKVMEVQAVYYTRSQP